ncbi:unnamed protein product [Paramecium sonneborni]|uniref:Uncharacterized protein n=1 Tax=Paramecium sonneborni TaxID=65129 RepID=A0A8S1R1T5_9CILI|nr:unnamed protein product [Paramecium sonneborni]
MFNQIDENDEQNNFQSDSDIESQNQKRFRTRVQDQEEEIQDLCQEELMMDQQEILQQKEYQIEDQDSNNSNDQVDQAENLSNQDINCSEQYQQKQETIHKYVLEQLFDKSIINNQEQFIEEQNRHIQDQSFQQQDEVTPLNAQTKYQNLKTEAINIQMDQINQEYQVSAQAYYEEKQKQIRFQQMQLQLKFDEYKYFLEELMKNEFLYLSDQYEKQYESTISLFEKKKQILQQKLNEELEAHLNSEKLKLEKRLERDLENYQDQKQKINKNYLILLQQKLFFLRLRFMKKLISENNQNIDSNNNMQIQISERTKQQNLEFNQYRIQIIQSIEENIRLLYQEQSFKLSEYCSIIKRQFELKRQLFKYQQKIQTLKDLDQETLMEKSIQDILTNQLIIRKKYKEQLFEEEVRNLELRELKFASCVNLNREDQEVKQIKIDNFKQFLAQKKKLNDKLQNDFEKFKIELQNKYQSMKNNLVQLQIEKFEKQKSLHENNRQNQLILEQYQDIIKTSKFIGEILVNLKNLETQKQRIKKKLEDLQIKVNNNQLQNAQSQISILKSDINNLNDHIRYLKQEDQQALLDLDMLQKQFYMMTSHNEYQSYEQQTTSYILFAVQELYKLNEDKTKVSRAFVVPKNFKQESKTFKIERNFQIPIKDHFDEINLRQIKKWKAFLLNQRLICQREFEICKGETEKLELMENKLKKDISQIDNEFQQKNGNKKENELKSAFLEKLGQMLKYQQSQIVVRKQWAKHWEQILNQKQKALDKINTYISKKIPIQTALDVLKKFYSQYKLIEQNNEDWPQHLQVEDSSKYNFQFPSQYSYISQKQDFDLQYILLI